MLRQDQHLVIPDQGNAMIEHSLKRLKTFKDLRCSAILSSHVKNAYVFGAPTAELATRDTTVIVSV